MFLFIETVILQSCKVNFRFVLTSGVVLKLIRKTEISRANSKEENTNAKHEYILAGMTDIYLSLEILIFCLKYLVLKLYAPTLA